MLIEIGELSSFKEGQLKLAVINNKNYAIVKLKGNFYCLRGNCTHNQGPLWEGTIEGNTLICPWHSAQFDIKTGKVLRGPALVDLKILNLKQKDGKLFADVK
ncbi:MAG: Rieske 2Fe-2S domain-containing protein [Nanoarchaeota archaeon]